MEIASTLPFSLSIFVRVVSSSVMRQKREKLCGWAGIPRLGVGESDGN